MVDSEGKGREWWAVKEEGGGTGMEWWGCVLVIVPSFRVIVVMSLSSCIDVMLSSCVVVACGCRIQ